MRMSRLYNDTVYFLALTLLGVCSYLAAYALIWGLLFWSISCR